MTVKYEELVVIKKSDLDKIIGDLEALKPNNGDTRLLKIAVLSNLQQLNIKPLIPFIEDSWNNGISSTDCYSNVWKLIKTGAFDLDKQDYINKEIEF